MLKMMMNLWNIHNFVCMMPEPMVEYEDCLNWFHQNCAYNYYDCSLYKHYMMHLHLNFNACIFW